VLDWSQPLNCVLACLILVAVCLDFAFFWWKQHLICTDHNVSATPYIKYFYARKLHWFFDSKKSWFDVVDILHSSTTLTCYKRYLSYHWQKCNKKILSCTWIVSRCKTTRAGVPNLGYIYPQGYICLSEGVHLRLATEEKNIFTYYLFPNIHTCISDNIFKNPYMLVSKYIYE